MQGLEFSSLNDKEIYTVFSTVVEMLVTPYLKRTQLPAEDWLIAALLFTALRMCYLCNYMHGDLGSFSYSCNVGKAHDNSTRNQIHGSYGGLAQWIQAVHLFESLGVETLAEV